jgi:iron(III) transport system substrate-binding protein
MHSSARQLIDSLGIVDFKALQAPTLFGKRLCRRRSGTTRPSITTSGDNMSTFFRLLSACALALGVLGGTASAADAPASSPVLYRGADREKVLLEGARKEGALTVYSVLTVPDQTDIANAFEKKYGIRPTFWRASTEDVLRRAVTEYRAGRHSVDVVENNSPELEALHRENALQKGWSPHEADLLPSSIQPHGEWVAIRMNLFVQAYNTNLVKKEDFPRSFQDLLDPKWKGKLGIEAGDFDWFSVVIKELGEEKGVKLFRDIVATNGISVRKGHTLLAGLTASGEVPMALTLYNHNADQVKAKGAPVEWGVIAPAVLRLSGMGVAKSPPHPYAAALFYDFMLTDGQAILAKNTYLTASRKTTSGILKGLTLKVVDVNVMLDQGDKWEKIFNSIFIDRKAN